MNEIKLDYPKIFSKIARDLSDFDNWKSCWETKCNVSYQTLSYKDQYKLIFNFMSYSNGQVSYIWVLKYQDDLMVRGGIDLSFHDKEAFELMESILKFKERYESELASNMEIKRQEELLEIFPDCKLI